MKDYESIAREIMKLEDEPFHTVKMEKAIATALRETAEQAKSEGMKFAKEHTGYLNEVWDRNEKIKALEERVKELTATTERQLLYIAELQVRRAGIIT
jgi:cytochrome c556